MPYLNSVTIMGYLAVDPELRHVASGEAVTTLRLGVSYTRSEDKTRRADFFDCEVWGGWATNVTSTAKKGALVLAEGRLAEDRWVDAKTNQTRSRTKIVARRAFHIVQQFADKQLPGAGTEEVASEPPEAASSASPSPSPWD
jgi:single-strand DNA-binding protein